MLNIFDECFLGIALAMDCFTISIAAGIILKKLCFRTLATMSISFGIFQSGMTYLGWSLTNKYGNYIEPFDHWIAFALLSIIGGKMIYDEYHKSEEYKFNPSKFIVIITLAIATSIDALAVGVSLTCMGIIIFEQIIRLLIVIGLSSLLLSICGQIVGVYIEKKFKLHSELIGGIILIFIGIKVLIEHIYLN
jgi:putative Mn2+ efflux pump MntP